MIYYTYELVYVHQRSHHIRGTSLFDYSRGRILRTKKGDHVQSEWVMSCPTSTTPQICVESMFGNLEDHLSFTSLETGSFFSPLIQWQWCATHVLALWGRRSTQHITRAVVCNVQSPPNIHIYPSAVRDGREIRMGWVHGRKALATSVGLHSVISQWKKIWNVSHPLEITSYIYNHH